jgi:phosphoesterase RecJ-like protein
MIGRASEENTVRVDGICKRPVPQEILAALRNLHRPVIAAHVTPDADCLGAALGLATALHENRIEASLALPTDCVAKRLEFMLALAPQVRRVAVLNGDHPFDGLIVVDTASEKRINMQPAGMLQSFSSSISIDHHITNTDFARNNWVDPHAASTCEMIARLIFELGWTISPSAASLLYCGIHGDTAGFSLPSTSAESLYIAAELIRVGADVSHIGEQLCRSQGRQDFELLRRVYDHTTLVDDGRIAYSYLSYQDIVESGCKADDIDDQVSIPRALRGVSIAMLFSEGEAGTIRVNLRGEGKTTVVEVAQRFGGGGHSQSAGVRVRNKPMTEVIEMLVAAAREHIRGS